MNESGTVLGNAVKHFSACISCNSVPSAHRLRPMATTFRHVGTERSHSRNAAACFSHGREPIGMASPDVAEVPKGRHEQLCEEPLLTCVLLCS